MNPKNNFATHLSKFLRLNGEKVIAGSSKLSLTTSALCQLNNLFDSILFASDGAPVIAQQASELFEDVKFLFDFVRKTSSLKIFHGMQTLRGGIDLSRFSHLSTLEFHKVPMHLVIGLDVLRPQLTVLICHRSICFLKEIFGNFEINQQGIWAKLKELNIAYNYLEDFDPSVEILPHLEYIDASHNSLKHVDEIQSLNRLEFVNLSYNSLENIPLLTHTLKVLSMRNNILESVEGLEMLPCLEELDVSYNCISEHSSLKPLKRLHKLRVLSLEGNPLFFHKKHRLLTARYFHSAVINNGILLDRKVMNAEEVLSTMRETRSSSFYSENVNTHQTAINVLIEDLQHSRMISGVRGAVQVETFAADNGSTCSTEESDVRKETAGVEKLVHGVRKKRVKKGSRKAARNSENLKSAVPEPAIPSHIETKHLLETRRKEYREGWLIPTPSFQHFTDINLNVPPNTPVANVLLQQAQSTPEQIAPEDALLSKVSVPVVEPLESLDDACGTEATIENDIATAKERRKLSEISDDIEVLMPHAENTADSALFATKDVNANDSYGTDYFGVVHSASDDSEGSENCNDESCFFLVENYSESEMQSFLIKVRENLIKEVDSSGKTAEVLDLRCLKSVDVDKVDNEEKQLSLVFDTIRTSRQKRKYVFENAEAAQRVYVKLKSFADARVFEDSILGALQCLKCGSEFSKDCAEVKVIKTKNPYAGVEAFVDGSKDFLKEASACQNCGSTVVIQIERMPLPSVPTMNSPAAAIRTVFSTSPSKKLNPDDDISHIPFCFTQKEASAAYRNSPSFNRKQLSGTKEYASALCTDPKTVERLKSQAKEPSSSAHLKARRNSSQSNQSSSITVISDTESNLDVIPEKVSAASPVTSSPAQVSCQSPAYMPLSHGTQVSMSSMVTPTAVLSGSSNVMKKQVISSSVTESLGNECVANFNELSDEQNSLHSSENINLINLFQGKESFRCEMFTSIDHRLKLHLEVVVFDDDEILLACLQAGVVSLSTGEEFPGLFVISSKRLFVMKFLQNISDRFEKNIKHIFVCTLKQLNVVRNLLGNQGLSITCGSDNKAFVFLIRDADLCNCFISHLIEITNERFQEPDLPQFILETEESLSQIDTEIFSNYEGESYDDMESEILLHLFGYWSNEEKKNKQAVCFIVTPNSIFVAGLLFKKQSGPNIKSSLFHYVPLEMQRLSNLLEVKIKQDLVGAEILFKDEEKNVASQWTVTTETKSSLFSFISAFKNPWDAIFGIDLPLSLSAE